MRTDNIVVGATKSDCKLPCTTYSYTTRRVVKAVKQNYNFIDFIPSEKIEVTETRLMKTTFTEGLAELVEIFFTSFMIYSIKITFLGGVHGSLAWSGNTSTF